MHDKIGLEKVALIDAKGAALHSLHAAGEDGYLRFFTDKYLRPLLEVEGYAPIQIIAVWDGGNDYRKQFFPGYKRSRQADTEQQKKVYHEIMRLLAELGGWNLKAEESEADDVIALFCRQLQDKVHITILTSDNDLVALTSPTCTVKCKGSVKTDMGGVPHQLITLYKSLVGDSSDEYPGVKGIGPVTWAQLVEGYGYESLEILFEWVVNNTPEKLAEVAEDDEVLNRILDNWGTLQTMYQCAKFHPDSCYRAHGKRFVKPEWYCKIPTGGGLDKFMARTKLTMDPSPWLIQNTLVTRDNFDTCAELALELVKETPVLAYDLEAWDTLGRDWSKALPDNVDDYVDTLSQAITGFSFTLGKNLNRTFYVQVDHKETDVDRNVDKDKALGFLTKLLESTETFRVAHNAKFEVQVVKQECGYVCEGVADTAIWSSYVDENQEMGLKDNSFRAFRYSQTEYKDLLTQCQAANMRELTGMEVVDYGCDDATCTARLAILYWMTMHLEGTADFVLNQDRFTVHPFARAFEVGINVSIPRMLELQAEDEEATRKADARLRELLEQHCSEPSEEAALAFLKADWDNLSAIKEHSARQTGSFISSEKMNAYRGELYCRYVKATTYEPYTVTAVPVEWKPTASGLETVFKALQIPYKEPVTTTRKYVTATVLATTGICGRAEKFMQALAAAAHLLPKSVEERSKHPEYLELVRLGAEYCGTPPKEVVSGDALNVGSPNQMQEILYLKLKLPVRNRTMPQPNSQRRNLRLQGSPGTDDEAISMAIAEDTVEGDWRREALNLLLVLKSSKTRKQLFFAKYPHWPHPKDGRIHPGLKNCGTGTRRPTGTSPNVLQVSKGPLRSMFRPLVDPYPPGGSPLIYVPGAAVEPHVIVCLDFNGQELRIAGSEAKDPVLIEVYTSMGTYLDDGMVRTAYRDVHSSTACTFLGRLLEVKFGTAGLDAFKFNGSIADYDFFREVYKSKQPVLQEINGSLIDLSEIAAEARSMAKVVNFLLIYLGTPPTLAMKLGIKTSFAEEIQRLVFQGIPRLADWQQETIQFACSHGYVQTAYGTRKHCNADLLSSNLSAFNRIARQSVNHVIQGGAADILKVVLTEAHHRGLWESHGAALMAPVYDELANSVPVSQVFSFIQMAQDCMNVTPPGHAIPMLAEVCIGKDWQDAKKHELGDRPSERKVNQVLKDIGVMQ